LVKSICGKKKELCLKILQKKTKKKESNRKEERQGL
jgi:hypothetical protein